MDFDLDNDIFFSPVEFGEPVSYTTVAGTTYSSFYVIIDRQLSDTQGNGFGSSEDRVSKVQVMLNTDQFDPSENDKFTTAGGITYTVEFIEENNHGIAVLSAVYNNQKRKRK